MIVLWIYLLGCFFATFLLCIIAKKERSDYYTVGDLISDIFAVIFQSLFSWIIVTLACFYLIRESGILDKEIVFKKDEKK